MKKAWMIALLLALALMLAACGGGSKETAAAPAKEEAAADGLKIEIASLAAEPSFIDWKQDGVDMQLLALKNDGGEVQLAYNTCQSCAGSPYAYFEYADGMLTCQNCGNRFGLDTVGRVAGGCNPKPVLNAAVEGGAIVIPTPELVAVAPEFKNWKAF